MEVSYLTAFNMQELVDLAREARQHAYAPYSKYQVGAALLAKSGKIYTGCNVENASYGATICAERTAMVKAVAAGEREFTAIAIVTDGSKLAAPCGICRQFLAEFGLELQIILANLKGEIKQSSLADYLPAAFNQTFLQE